MQRILKISLVFFLLTTAWNAQSQSNVSIGTDALKDRAILWLNGNGTNQGLLLPAVANRTSFTGLNNTDDKGMIIFDRSDNKVYYWNGSAWVDAGGGTASNNQVLTLSGNTFSLSGSPASTANLSSTAPSNGQALVWNGTAWAATTITTTLAGEVTGPSSATTIANDAVTSAKILNGTIAAADLNTMGATANQVLQFNGTVWAPATLSGGTNTLNSGQVFVGNASNVATGVSLSGDISTVTPAGAVTIANGAINNAKLGADAVTAAKILDGTITGSDLANATVTATQLAADAVTSAKIADGTIVAADLNTMGATANQVLQFNGTAWVPATPLAGSNTLNSGQVFVGNASNVATGVALSGDISTVTTAGAVTIANGAINNAKLGADAVTSAKILDGTISGTDMANATVTATQLANNAVTSAKILDGTIAGTDMANATVTATQLANDAVTSAKILDGTIAAADLNTMGATANQVLQFNGTAWVPATPLPGSNTLNSGQVFVGNASNVATGVALSGDISTVTAAGAVTIANGAINNAKLGADAVTSAKILDGTITGTDMANATVTATQLANNAVTSAKILDGTIAGTDMANATVTATQLANDAVTSAKILDGTIVAADLNTMGATANQVLQFNGTAWVPATPLPGSNTLNSGQVFVGNASNVATGVALSGDISTVTTAGAVTIANGAINNAKLGADAVTSAKVLDGTISGTDMANATVTATQLANNAVTSAKILDGTIAGTDMANATVTATQLANDAVTSAKILDGTIVAADLNTMGATANQVLQFNGTAWVPATPLPGSNTLNSGQVFVGNASNVATGVALSGDISTVTTAGAVTIANGAINNAKLGADAVTSAKILDGTITGTDMANATVTTTQLANDAVTAAKILDGTITGNDMANAAVTATQLANDAVTSAKILDGTIAAADLGTMGATSSQVLQYNGTVWAPATISTTPALNSGQVFVGDASNVAAGVTLSGDIATVTVAGGVTIANSAITTAKILDGTILNADINSAAAIAGSKINPAFGAQAVSTTGSGSFGNLAFTGTLSVGAVPSVGTAGQVLTSAGAGNPPTWTTAASAGTLQAAYDGSPVVTGANAMDFTLDNGFLVKGTLGTGAIPATGTGTRMMFYPRKAAFRAGTVGAAWDDANIGTSSFAGGENALASGSTSTSIGKNTIASGTSSFAGGEAAQATGFSSTAFGFGAVASGMEALSVGRYTVAAARSGIALGHFNISGGTGTSWVGTEPLFEIGNGTDFTDRQNAVTVLQNGRTGIGVFTPAQLLDVNGNINVATTFGYYINNARVLSNAGTRNLVVGELAGGTSTGTDNTFVGWNAGARNTTGSFNTLIGRNSAAAGVITGSYNIALGVDAGNRLTSGGLNTLLGFNAGYSLTTGAGSTMIGGSAGEATTGSFNTFVGEHSGELNTSGANNVFIGRQSGNTNITGNGNTVIGTDADIADGITNATAIGWTAQATTSHTMILGQTGGNTPRVGIGLTNPTAQFQVYEDNTGVANYAGSFRKAGSGGLVSFEDGTGTLVGDITYSGTTVSYNAFTGSHYATLRDAAAPDYGMLVSLTGKITRPGGERGEPRYEVIESSIANDPKVMGTYSGTLDPAKHHLIMAVGNGEMWVVDQGENLVQGDYLISSSVSGHAMKDNGEFEIAYIVARVAESVDWSTVTESVDGKKHKRISVFFETFTRNHKAEKLEKELRRLEADVRNNRSENDKKMEMLQQEVELLKKLVGVSAKN